MKKRFKIGIALVLLIGLVGCTKPKEEEQDLILLNTRIDINSTTKFGELIEWVYGEIVFKLDGTAYGLDDTIPEFEGYKVILFEVISGDDTTMGHITVRNFIKTNTSEVAIDDTNTEDGNSNSETPDSTGSTGTTNGSGNNNDSSTGTNTNNTTTKNITVKETIKFTTETHYNDQKPKGETTVIQAGQNGTKEVTYKVTYVNGKETGREWVRESITVNPVAKIVEVGTFEETVACPNGIYPDRPCDDILDHDLGDMQFWGSNGYNECKAYGDNAINTFTHPEGATRYACSGITNNLGNIVGGALKWFYD